MSFDIEAEVLLLLALAEEESQDVRKKRRKWVHELSTQRIEFGEFRTLIPTLRKDKQRFYIYFRMPEECYNEVLSRIEQNIRKQYTNLREPIEPSERLAICLRYLGTGDSMRTIAHSYRVGISTVALIVKEVCLAICDNMGPIYLPEPTTESWARAANSFQENWQFPNCCGAIDGKHVTIECPPNTGSNYFCYLKKFSIVLMAVADAEYKFISVDIGGYGKNSDGGILENSLMGRRFEDNTMNLPPPKELPGENFATPHVLIGDEAFALKPYLMRPFPYRVSRGDREKDNYNYRLCRARRVVENTFGILTKKWRIYRSPLQVNVETAKLVVLATCILHNFLRTKKLEDDIILTEPDSMAQAFELLGRGTRRSTNSAFDIRDNFVRYFNNNRINNNRI